MPLSKNVITDIKSQKRSAWILVVSAIVLLGVLLCMRCFLDYRQEVQQLEERLTAQARVVDENLTANLYAINLTLENIRQELDDNSGHLTDYLRMQNKFSQGIRTIVVTDSQGHCIHSNRDELVGRDLSQRDYFTTPRGASDKSLTFMSPPFKTVLGAFVINITKTILGKKGEFKGVVSISLDPNYFLTLLKSTIYASDYRIGLIHSDGTVFTSIPEGSTSVTGKMLLKPGTLFYLHAQSGTPFSIQSGRSSTTGDNRAFAYINNNPTELRFDKHLVIAASRNLDEVLLHWKILTGSQFLLYLLLTLLLVGITKKMSRRGDELSRLHITQMSILESVGEGILGMDRSGAILFCNQAAGQLTGMNSNDLIGHNFHQTLHNDASGHDTADCPLHLTLKDGVSRSVNNCALAHLENVEHTVSPLIEQNAVVGAVIVFRDVTKKRKSEATRALMEEKLRASEERYIALFENAGDAIVIMDANGLILSANKILCQRLGYTEAELLGKTPAHFDSQKYAELVPERMKMIAEKGEAIFETEHIAKNGTLFSVEVSVRVVELTGHSVVMSIVRDITERKTMEKELRHALETARSTNSTMSRLMSVVAHEFRTPLSLLTSSTDILDRYSGRLTHDQVIEQNETIRSAARQMSGLIDSVLSFNRQESDGVINMPEPLDIGRISQTIAAEVALVWGAGYDFQVTIAKNCGTILLNERLYRRVIENLLTNAFRYSPSGKAVSLSITRESDRLKVVVADSGIGIPDEDKKRIFDAFYRGKNVEARRGLGLGLSIVREALLHIGGSITVKSAIGEGTTMRVDIPLVNVSSS